VISLTESGEWVGFCYIESWEHEKFVAGWLFLPHSERAE
jgi:hypothetical protein